MEELMGSLLLSSGNIFILYSLKDIPIAIESNQNGEKKEQSENFLDLIFQSLCPLFIESKIQEINNRLVLGEQILSSNIIASLLYRRGTCYLLLGEQNLAVNDFYQCLSLCPSAFIARFMCARAHLSQGEYEKAIKLLTWCIENHEKYEECGQNPFASSLEDVKNCFDALFNWIRDRLISITKPLSLGLQDTMSKTMSYDEMQRKTFNLLLEQEKKTISLTSLLILRGLCYYRLDIDEPTLAAKDFLQILKDPEISNCCSFLHSRVLLYISKCFFFEKQLCEAYRYLQVLENVIYSESSKTTTNLETVNSLKQEDKNQDRWIREIQRHKVAIALFSNNDGILETEEELVCLSELKYSAVFIRFLPREIMIEILSFLNHKERCVASYCCRYIHALCQSDKLWKRLYIKLEQGNNQTSVNHIYWRCAPPIPNEMNCLNDERVKKNVTHLILECQNCPSALMLLQHVARCCKSLKRITLSKCVMVSTQNNKFSKIPSSIECMEYRECLVDSEDILEQMEREIPERVQVILKRVKILSHRHALEKVKAGHRFLIVEE